MRQRHVAHAEAVVHAENAQRVVDGMAALDADERGNLAVLVNADNIVSSRGHGKGVGIVLDELVDEVDLLEGLGDRLSGLGGGGSDECGPELGADASLP